MDKQLHRLETFRVQDMHGALYTVHAFEHLTRVGHLLDMRTEWEPTGLVEFKLDTGEHLDVEPDGAMHLPGSDLLLRRLDATPMTPG